MIALRFQTGETSDIPGLPSGEYKNQDVYNTEQIGKAIDSNQQCRRADRNVNQMMHKYEQKGVQHGNPIPPLPPPKKKGGAESNSAELLVETGSY